MSNASASTAAATAAVANAAVANAAAATAAANAAAAVANATSVTQAHGPTRIKEAMATFMHTIRDVVTTEVSTARNQASHAKTENTSLRDQLAQCKRDLEEARPKLDLLKWRSVDEVKRMRKLYDDFQASLAANHSEKKATKQSYVKTLKLNGLAPGNLAHAVWSDKMSSIVKVSGYCGARPDCVHVIYMLQVGTPTTCMLNPMTARLQLTMLNKETVAAALSAVVNERNIDELYKHDRAICAAVGLDRDAYGKKLAANTRAEVDAQFDLNCPNQDVDDDDCVIVNTRTVEERNSELRNNAVNLVGDSD